MNALVELKGICASLQGERVLHYISWTIERGQQWLLVGPNGSGKSTLMRVLGAELWPEPRVGTRTYNFTGTPSRSPIDAKRHIAIVSPELQTKFKNLEYSLTGWQVVLSAFSDTFLLYSSLNTDQISLASCWVDRLAIRNLMDVPIQEMSYGELRKVLIARAVVRQPALLLLDEVCSGLDPAARRDILNMLDQIALSGVSIVISSHRDEDVFPSITHVIRLQDGRVVWQGRISEYYHLLQEVETEDEQTNVWRESLHIHNEQLTTESPSLIEIQGADVYLNNRQVLKSINWMLHPGQHWIIRGGNGAGKSTFLRLILGDYRPALGGTISRFGLDRLGLWEIKKYIGYYSPEMQEIFRRDLIVEEVIASGFEASFEPQRPFSQEQMLRVREVMRFMEIGELTGKPLGRMSHGQLRKVLLARAFVNSPKILLLDEPFDGLDFRSRSNVSKILGYIARNGTSLVLTSHYNEDIPAFITHQMLMSDGRIVEQGALVAND